MLFSAVNIKICGGRNVRKYRENNGSDKYVTLDISGKGLITALGIKAKVRPHTYKNQGMPS